ncbi:MAG: extracellular solute-binding protein [Clostridiaceae bacterium]|nr:extracellular solute-binding protein [Clostridiaceae bacterium]
MKWKGGEKLSLKRRLIIIPLVSLVIIIGAAIVLGVLSFFKLWLTRDTGEGDDTGKTIGEQVGEQDGDKTGEVAKPDVIELTVSGYFGDASDYPEYKEEWPKAMEREFDIKFKVNYPSRNNYMEKVNLMITSGDIKGMTLLFTPDDVVKAIEDGTIEPMDEYLKGNEVWESLPEEMKKMYEYNGRIYAIPKGLTPNMFTRSIRQDWLEKFELKVPETVDELELAFQKFTFDDPDGNGINDTYGYTSSFMWNLQDIFQAFDARLNHVGESPVTYDPNENSWVDSMLKPGMVDCLSYLARHFKGGILDREIFTNAGNNMREKVLSGKCGSTFYWYDWVYSFESGVWEYNPEAKFANILALKGRITANINHISYSNAPYVLIKGTSQPKEVVNWFVNIFFGDEKGHFMGRVGLMGEKGFDIEGKTIIIHEVTEGKGPPTADIVNEIPRFSRTEYPYFYEYLDEDWHKEYNLRMLKKEVDMDKGIRNGILYHLFQNNQVPVSESYAKLDADSKKLFQEAIVKAISGELSPQEAIERYRAQMKAIGAQEVLDDANAAMGLEVKTRY